MRLIHPAAALAMVAVRAGSHDVGPTVLAAQVPRRHVIHSQIAFALSTILASIIIAAKDLTAGQFDVWTRPMDLVLQPDH